MGFPLKMWITEFTDVNKAHRAREAGHPNDAASDPDNGISSRTLDEKATINIPQKKDPATKSP